MEFIEGLSESAFNNLKKYNDELTKTVSKVNEVGNAMKGVNTPSGSDNAIKKLTADYEAQEKTIKKLQGEIQKLIDKQNNDTASKKKQVQAILDQAKSYQSLEKQKTKAIADIEKEITQLQKSENAYEKVKAKINAMLPAYNNLKTKVELGIKLSKDEERQLALNQGRLIKYREVLNKVNKEYGNYSLEVGNYAKANGNMSIATGQIARELTNFGQSFSVGVLSLTNNAGQLIDAYKQINAQNAELKKQGKETTSAFGQMLSSFLGWQTALFIGIGFISAYSQEIGDFFQTIFVGASKLDTATKSLIAFQNAQAKGLSNARNELQIYDEYLSIAGNKALGYEKQKVAIDQLRSSFGGYLQGLSDEQIMKLKGSKIDKEIRTTLGYGERYKANLTEIQQISEKIEMYKKEVDERVKFNRKLKQAEADRYDTSKSGKEILQAEKLIITLKKQEALRKESIKDEELKKATTGDVMLQQLALEEMYNVALQQSLINKEKSILLEAKDDKDKNNKAKKEKIKLTFDEVESEYVLKLAILERQKAERADRMNNEDLGLDIRLQARKEYSEKSIEILNLEIEKEKALYTEKYKDDLEKNNLAYRNKELSAKEWGENLKDITNRYNNELATVDMQFSLKWNDLLNEDADFYRKVQDEKREYSDKTNKLILDSEKSKFKKIADDDKKTLEVRQKAFEQYLELAKKELAIEKAKELAKSKTNEEVIEINERYAQAFKALDGLDSPLINAQKATETWLKSLSDGQLTNALDAIGLSSAKMFLDIDKNGQTTYTKLIEGAGTLGEKLAITFKGIGDIAKDVFSKIEQASSQRFQTAKENLQKEYQVALLFAGESAEAKAEIDRQYEAKLREIRIREFKAKKRLAIVEANINIAQGVIASLAKGGTAGIVMAGIIGALGIVQLATIQNQEMPEYWTGTENAKEGFAKTQERGREFIFDKSGKLKSTGSDKGTTITKMDAGDKVWNAEKTRQALDSMMFNDQLNNILSNNGISSPIVNNRINDDRIVNALNSVESAINNKSYEGVKLDENGIKKYISNGQTTTYLTNNRRTFTPRNT